MHSGTLEKPPRIAQTVGIKKHITDSRQIFYYLIINNIVNLNLLIHLKPCFLGEFINYAEHHQRENRRIALRPARRCRGGGIRGFRPAHWTYAGESAGQLQEPGSDELRW